MDSELLFFDTFIHDSDGDVNLDLVQFPRPVSIREVRVIPLGSKIEGDFPGGSRMGATNPSSFTLDFYVNNLAKQASCVFDHLGSLNYNQNSNISLHFPVKNCVDGLLISGKFAIVTLAVYGNEVSVAVETPAEENVSAASLTGVSSTEPVQVKQEIILSTEKDIPVHVDYQPLEVKVEVEAQSDFNDRSRTHERNYRKHSSSDYEDEERRRSVEHQEFPLRSPTPPPGRMNEIQSPISEETPMFEERTEVIPIAITREIQKEDYILEAPRLQQTPEMEETEREDFEEILSDEDGMEDFDQYQEVDAEIADYGEEFFKTFGPDSFEVKKYSYLADPSTTQFATQIRQLHCLSTAELQRIQVSGEKLQQLLSEQHWSSGIIGVGEKFVNSVEQVTKLLPDGLVYLAAVALQDPNAELALESAERVLFDWLMWSLDFSKAMEEPQPVFKVRHIKAGLKFAQVVPNCSDRLFLTALDANLFGILINLFSADYMALSLKLSCLQAIDSAISTTPGIERLLKSPDYERLHSLLFEKQSSRVKVAIAAIMTKIGLFEAANALHCSILDLIRFDPASVAFERQKIDGIIMCLSEIVRVLSNPKVFVGQQARFLPAQTQMEIPGGGDYWPGLYAIQKSQKFLHSVLVLLAHPALLADGKLNSLIESLLEILSETEHGLRFLGSEPEVTTLIVRQLMHVYDQMKGDEFSQEDAQMDVATSLRLGSTLAHRLYVLQCVDTIFSHQKTFAVEPDNLILVNALQSIQNLVFSASGKPAVISVLSMKDHIKPFLAFAQIDEDPERERVIRNLATRGYAVDLIETVAKHSQNIDFYRDHAESLLEIAKQDENRKLNSLIPWLELPMKRDLLGHNGLLELIAVVKSCENDCINYPPKLLIAVKVLASLVVPPKLASTGDYVELKYSYAVVQLFSADMMTSLVGILTKIVENYNQPSWHAPSLSGSYGAYLVALVYPILQIMMGILSEVIRCRNTEFHDLTPIPHLLGVYELLSIVPASCFMHVQAQQACSEVVRILLAYTQPVIQVDPDSAEDLLVKSLWTQMIQEVLKYALNGTPTNFLTGLHIFSELFPLPLPITANSDEVTEEEYTEQVNARKLWAAHLHCLLPQLNSVFDTLCSSAYTPVQCLLRRVAVQLADLAPSTAVAVVKSLLDSLLRQVAACIDRSRDEQAKKVPDSFLADEAPTASTLLMSNLTGIVPKLPVLNILCYVTSFPCGKAAVLHIVQSQKDDKYGEILELLLALLTKTPRKHLQVQENLLTIFQFLADAEVGLAAIRDDDVGLGNALPNKDSLIAIINGLLDYLRTCDGQFQLIPSALRIISYLCERNQTFGLVVRCIRENPSVLPDFILLLSKSISQDSSDTIQSLVSLVDLLRLFSQSTVHTDPDMVPPRSFFLPVAEVTASCGGLGPDSPLAALHSSVQRLGNDLAQLKSIFAALIEDMQKSARPVDQLTELPEFNVPLMEPLVNQWANRIVVTQMATTSQNVVDEEKLTGPAWFATQLSDEAEVEMEQERCDILELTKSLLPEWNFVSEVERVCRVEEPVGLGVATQLKPENTVEGGITTKSQEKTLSILSSVDGQKRPFVAPMRGRGFNRGMNTRTDSFRLRPSNTSRPPSLHVDDFVAMESSNNVNYGKDARNRRPARGAFSGEKPRFGNEPQFRQRGGTGRPAGPARNGGARQSGQPPAGQRPLGYGGGSRGAFGERRGRARGNHWAEERPGRGDRRDRGGYGARNFQR